MNSNNTDNFAIMKVRGMCLCSMTPHSRVENNYLSNKILLLVTIDGTIHKNYVLPKHKPIYVKSTLIYGNTIRYHDDVWVKISKRSLTSNHITVQR